MGFGILFLGYFATTMMEIPLSMILPVDLGGVAKLLGYVLIIIAAKKLFEYNSTFKSLIVSSSLMAGISGFEAFVDVTAFLDEYQIAVFPFSDALIYLKNAQIIDYIYFGLLIIFISTLCLSIKHIARDIELKSIEIAATRNFIFYCILLVLQAITFIPFKYKAYFGVAFVIVQLICWGLNLYMLFSCYAKICDPGDVEMKQKPSRFSFINQKREEQEIEEQQILDEYATKISERKKKKKKK